MRHALSYASSHSSNASNPFGRKSQQHPASVSSTSVSGSAYGRPQHSLRTESTQSHSQQSSHLNSSQASSSIYGGQEDYLRPTEKRPLPPGAASVPIRYGNHEAYAEREALDSALRESEEEEQIAAALRQSELDEQGRQEEEATTHDVIHESAEEARLRQEVLAIAQAEEEAALLRAMQESEQDYVDKGKGRGNHQSTAPTDEDEELQQVLQDSLREQEEEYENARRNAPSSSRQADPSGSISSGRSMQVLDGHEDAPPAYEADSESASAKSAQAREQAERQEAKRAIFYPPIADNEMTEGVGRIGHKTSAVLSIY